MASRAQLWLNFGRTCNLGLANFSMGLFVAVTGATLVDMVQLYGSSMASISYLTTTGGVGSLLGSLLGGKLYDTFNTQVVSILATAMTCVTVVMTPLSGYLAIAHVVTFLQGLSAAAFSTGAHVWIIRMWPNSTPALQAYHLIFGIGGLLGPFIARPFLSPSTGGNPTSQNATGFYLGRDGRSFDTIELLSAPNHTKATNATGETHISYAFGIVGALFFVATVSMIALYLVDKADFQPEKAQQIADESTTVVEQPQTEVCFSRSALAAMCTYLGFYAAVEYTTSQMVVPFAVKSDLQFSKSSAAGVESLFFLCFTASRLGAALVTVKLPSFWVLVISHVILLPTAAILAVWGSGIDTVLWVGIAFSGIGEGPIYAAMVSWTAGHIEFNNKMMSVAIVTESIGSMLATVLVGQFIDKTPNVFLYVCLAATLFFAVVFFFMCLYLRKGPHISKDKELIINGADRQLPEVES